MPASDDPGYYGRYNAELLKLIPPDAKTVLEIGCGEGALCEAYRRMNPGVEWVGVDKDRDALERAMERGVVTLHRDVNECRPAMEDDFDVAILGDVLEHLTEPLETLQWVAAHALPGAQVLASIPNIQHWTAIRSLLAGEWEYADEGLFDRGHLRFFTRKSIEAMFAAAGLQIFEIRGTRYLNGGFEPWWDTEIKQPKSGPLWINSQVYQWIVRAVKPEMRITRHGGMTFATGINLPLDPIDKLHIHAQVAEACCARPRILEPFQAMGTIPGVTCTVAPEGATGKAPDIVIQQRNRKFSLDDQRWLLARGSLIVAELDDEPETIGVLPDALRAVHAVQVSTEPLAEIVRRYNPNVAVFENQIAVLPEFIPDDTSGGTPNAGIFYGAQNRQADWAPIIPAINRIANDPNVVVWFEVVHDREFFEALETTAKRFHPFLPYDQYRGILRSCDIALLPLEPGPFNECKSDLKFLECAAEGVAVLAGKTVYGKTIIDNCEDDDPIIGYCYSHVGDRIFESTLRFLIKSPENRRHVAKNAYAYVRDHRMLGQHFKKQASYYRSLMDRKLELNRQLLARCPDLAGGQPVAPDL
jgi:2-polyprenyl-3-methyl-5-hydroxy-6-metoxy-1,4-benzoquinol methylase